MRTEIIFEDKELLVVRKPAGFATQTAGVGQADVVSELKNYLASRAQGKGQPYLGIIHRLDQPVEGLLVFAKNKKAAAALTKQLGRQDASGGLNKQYYAVFCGKPSEKEGILVDYMFKGADGKAVIVEDIPEGVESRAVIVENGAKKTGNGGKPKGRERNISTGTTNAAPRRALLQYKILQTVTTLAGEEISLADIHIQTGRFHQIRAQMANAGMVLLGDVKYGDEAAMACSRRLGVQTVSLCAYKVAFSHPSTGESLSFEIHPCTKAFSFFEL